ncbi:MAG: hypothetical protein ABIY70_14145 [Capsulimonas sp.]|uniref:hypothetical protein n=1 Tax=Capsulimonas sp. TaxID=2494211 RepID=UPI0032673150
MPQEIRSLALLGSWITKPNDSTVVIRPPRATRIATYAGIAAVLLFLGQLLVLPLSSPNGRADTATLRMACGMMLFGWMCVYLLARMMAMEEMTVDLRRRTYEKRTYWPGPKTVVTGSMDEFSGVYIHETTQRVFLRRKPGAQDTMGIRLGAPPYPVIPGQPGRFRTAEYAEYAAHLLGVPFLTDPRTRITGARRLQTPVPPKRNRK